MKKKIGVFTSGGDSPGMNACVRAVTRTALHLGYEVVGIRYGYEGMINNDFIPLKSHDVSGILQQGGTILFSARSDRFRTKEGRQIAYENLAKAGINKVVAIGGDGTFTGANIFMNEHPDIAFVGCPGTIDNDLYGTDYTIGYDTAINTAMNAIDNIKDTANAHNRLFFVEVMGRDAGFIALRSAIGAGAEAVLIPETKTDVNALIHDLDKSYQQGKTSGIVVVAEGDDAGGAFEIAKKVKEKLTHYDIRVSILGHMQRGGRPTCNERILASRLGLEAVKALDAGKRSVMVGQIGHGIVYTPFGKSIKHHKEPSEQLLEMVRVLG